ncbi:hypothetical protein [Roseimaritima sediminicola]|uniref:hypothetical protein n=1 Tax=Roseimaritima sediminicola TaxID=2662066 RepID=UPI0012982FEE|nr:hypothetical protein [Roseimaritima sediminicola]
MARSPHHREDLLAEATAMPERGEFWLDEGPSDGELDVHVIGFRRSGAASLYFGEQPVLHFDPEGRLRRLFHDDQQILAAGGKLELRRRGDDGARMSGQRIPLDQASSDALLAALNDRLQGCLDAIAEGRVRWGRVTVETDAFVARVLRWRQSVGSTLRVGDL